MKMEIIKNIYQRKDSRGNFQEFINSETGWKAVNGGFMNKDAIMGNHYHKKCRTLFFIVKGSAKVLVKDVRKDSGNRIFENKTSGSKTLESKTSEHADSKIEEVNLKTSEGVIFEKYETHAIKFSEESIFLLLKDKKFDKDDQDIFEAKL